jgi:hypothetical protein
MKGLITNKHDRENLTFLLTASPETYRQWASSCSFDDLVYAEELLAAYAEEMRLCKMEIFVEECIETMRGNFIEAKQILKKFHVN